MTGRAAVESAIADAHRHEWAFVVAATVRVVRDLDLAEECVQEAYAAALQTWVHDGIPGNPAAWLTAVARRRGIDVIRRDQTFRSKMPLLIEPEETNEDTVVDERLIEHEREETVRDERLRLVFLCCHPALAQEAQVALTLRLVCGITTADIARAFLVSEPTMAARLTRAKKKIVGSRMPYRLPRPAELPDRLPSVLAVIHLLLTTGHTAPSGDVLVRVDLVETALLLARMLRDLMPDDAEVRGLLALVLVTDARRATRVSSADRLLRLEEQDRSLWNKAAITEAGDLITVALRTGRYGRYVLQAAIASVYAEAKSFDDTDWPQIVTLYDKLLQLWPSPVVALNRAVPLSKVVGPTAALAEVEALESAGQLTGYQYLPAVKADLLVQLGRASEAAEAYERALELTSNGAERQFLTERVASVRGSASVSANSGGVSRRPSWEGASVGENSQGLDHTPADPRIKDWADPA
jgi:RNA polymerase sigma-70 factor (ECF subfamily)